MIDKLKSLFTARAGAPAGKRPKLSHNELQLAAAVLLCHAARMDDDFAESERDAIATLLQARFGLSSEDTNTLIEAADEQAADAVDMWSAARLVKNGFSHDERVQLVEMLWEVAYADGVLHDYEAHLLRRIAGLIYVSDHERGAARKRVLARLGVDGTPKRP
jgi:uncharacterized tellurite resistance protein B-like protein